MRSLHFLPLILPVVVCHNPGDSMNSHLASDQSITSRPAIDSGVPQNLQTATFSLG